MANGEGQEYFISLENVAARLDGLKEYDGVPVCRSLDEQAAIDYGKHLCVYPNGNVMFFYALGCGVRWNPNVPLKDQIPASQAEGWIEEDLGA